MTQSVRIGNAQAFWGDRGDAAAEMLAREPELDFLTLDYLAEVSMSILAMQRERDPAAGYARDFIDVVRSLAPYWRSGGRCRLIVNAGGLNPRGCAAACRAALAEAGCRSLKIGVVDGDDVRDAVGQAAACADSPDFANLDTGAAVGQLRGRLVTANAYLGAQPMVEALDAGADLVIAGRVADPSLAVAACRHHFGWAGDERDRLAGATVAGHLIECGTQVTGGVSTDWLDVPDPGHIGFPIVEVAEDGSCVVTKPRGTGGWVTEWTVKEQLVYEIGDPARYLSPDVTVSFLALQVEALANDRVRVRGARGAAPPATYKVSATYRDGFRSAGTLTIFGRDAAAKARRCGELVLQRVRAGGFALSDSVIECLGGGAAAALLSGAAPKGGRAPEDSLEAVLRVAVEAESRGAVERFSRELMPFITAGPQGTTGYAEGRPRIHSVFRYWPCLIDRRDVTPRVEIESSPAAAPTSSDSTNIAPTNIAPTNTASTNSAPTNSDSANSDSANTGSTNTAPANTASTSVAAASSLNGAAPQNPAMHAARSGDRGPPLQLFDIACARSGDKGAGANLGVMARTAKAWSFLQNWLTAARVAEYFSPLAGEFGLSEAEAASFVERFEMPNLHALNFVLRGVLRRGLRTDAQGKALGVLLLEMPLPSEARTILFSGSTCAEGS